eukprot:503588-Prorocentrum_minimum.AAC.5
MVAILLLLGTSFTGPPHQANINSFFSQSVRPSPSAPVVAPVGVHTISNASNVPDASTIPVRTTFSVFEKHHRDYE